MSGRALVLCEGIWLAHTARPLMIAKALREEGWEVEFGASGKFTDLLRADGFAVHGIATMDPEEALAAIRSSRIAYNRRLVEEYVEDDVTLIRRLKPDVVLNDFRLSLAISGRLTGVPFANIVNSYLTNYYAPRRRAPHDFLLMPVLGRRASNAVLPPVMSLFVKLFARPFNAVTAAHGLERFGNIFDVMASPHLNLVCDLEEFMPLAGAPERFKFVGPVIWEPSVPPPDWLSRLDASRPTVYFTMGSTGFAHYYHALARAFEGTEYQVIITTGGQAPAVELPGNFSVAEFAPGLALLEKSDLVVCHGGNGTIYQALSKAVPILGIPTFHDQDFNMQRVEDLRLGAMLSPRELNGATLRETAERLIADTAVKANCRRFAEAIAATDAPRAAAREISALTAG